MTIRFAGYRLADVALTLLALSLWQQTPLAQVAPAASPSHVVIPFLASATKAMDLDFEGGECEVEASGNLMSCVFQQVFLTTSAVVPDTCLVTTNRYERAFRRETPGRWVSTEGPKGVCGLLDVTTLLDEGGVRWTMEMRQVLTKKDAAATCQTYGLQSETLSWQNVRRPLPCKFVQPGGLGR